MPHDKAYEDRVIYLTELIDKHQLPPLLEGFTFTGCQVKGPAVVYLVGNVTFNGCAFRNKAEEMLFEVPEGATKVGIIGLANCAFQDCEITMMGIAGPKAALDQIRATLPE